MQFKKLAAIGGTALMAALAMVGPAGASTVTSLSQVNSLASASAFPVFVIGASAAPSDVAGAVNIAVGMASSVGGGTGGGTVTGDGLSKNDIDTRFGNLTDSFPNPIRSFHFPGLTTGTIAWKGTNYNYHEQIWHNGTYFSHDFGTSGINGTETLVASTNQIFYEYVFDQGINLSSANNKGTLADPEFTDPIRVKLLGKEFLIVGIGSNQVKMLSGSSGTADATTPVSFGGYSVYATQGTNDAWAKVVVKDSSGNTVDTLVIDKTKTKTSTGAEPDLDIKVTAVRALTDGTVVGADLVVGPANAIEKTYTTSCDVTSTGVSDTRFSGETDWCVQVSGFANSGNVTATDKLQVVHKPQSTQYIKMTSATPYLNYPNSIGRILIEGFKTNTYATLTFQPVTGKSAYNSTGSVFASNLNGIEISSDTVGTLVDQAANTGYSKAYILFNYTLNSSTGAVMLGFYSTANSRIELPSTTAGGSYYKPINLTGLGNWTTFNVTVSYGGGASAADQHFLYANISGYGLGDQVSGGTSSNSWFSNLTLGSGTGGNSLTKNIRLNYVNKTATWSTTAAPEFRLYTDDAANAKDVQVLSTPAGGPIVANGGSPADIGVSLQDVVTDGGAIVVTPNTYSGSQQVVVKIPAEALRVKAFIGNPGAGTTTTTGGASTITSDIVRLDSEVSSADKTGKDLVLVGGPCVNTLVAELKTAGKFPYGCADWPSRNFGRIQLISGAFASGYTALVVAGTRAADTDAAARVVQTGTGLAAISGAIAEVSESGSVSTAT